MYALLYSFVYLLSLLPLRVLYVLSDALRFWVYRVARYRRRVVRANLRSSFPEKTEAELLAIEKRFYAFFCDYLVETIKLCSMSEREMQRRMTFEGVEEMVSAVKGEGKLFGFIYLAHYGNWEWVSSLSARVYEIAPDIVGGHIYHPLRNAAFNRLFLHMRSRFKGHNIPMKETLRFVLQKRKQGKTTIIGFIADQGPKWNNIHHWTPFLNHQTPVFTGTENIGKRVDALIFYAHVERPRRGYYHCRITRLVPDVKALPDYELTDLYFRSLEASIRREPAIWLWSHKRWKRTYEAYQSRQQAAISEGNDAEKKDTIEKYS